MKLPVEFQNNKEWVLIGPMGPQLAEKFSALPTIGIDGGARFCQRMDIWVGDGDSHLEKINSRYTFEFSPIKSQSDLALALSLFNSCGPVHLHCWGLLGGRRDHELLNLGEVTSFLEKSSDSRAVFYDSHGNVAMEIVASGTWKFNHQGLFSLASIKEASMKLTGACEYTLKNKTTLPPLSSLGLSNTAHGDFLLTTDTPVMVFFSESK